MSYPLRCPYCHRPVTVQAASCSSCGFSADALVKWLGPLPGLQAGINDLTETLTKRDLRRMDRARSAFQRDFPQCDLHFILGRFDPEVPLPCLTFAFMNFGVPAADDRRGGANRGLLLTTDLRSARSRLDLAYGLEHLVGERDLRNCLNASVPTLRDGQFAHGFEVLVAAWSRVLRRVAERLPATFALPRRGEVQAGLDTRVARLASRRRRG